jgi:transcriptional regulator with GAF, ATPase, and Fis domain
MLGRFANCPIGDVEYELEGAFRRICEFLEIECAGLWKAATEGGTFTLTHLYPARDSLPHVEQAESSAEAGTVLTCPGFLRGASADTSSCLPWLTTQVQRGQVLVFSRLDELPAEAAADKSALERMGIGSVGVFPFQGNGKVLGAASFARRAETVWPGGLVERLRLVTQILAGAVTRKVREELLDVCLAEMNELKASLDRHTDTATTERKLAEEALVKSYAEIKQLKDRLQAESDYLKAEIKVTQTHGEIIGRSAVIRKALHQTEQVAPADCPVLISGETGTGKELIAQEIHRLSARKERVMVLVNCAALPSALVESELFGRERGAYTGALTSQVGRFEIANGSTIFLDEVGELSMEVQAKLLRVLQQGEFQRLGSPKTHKVDVRVIAATNRDLAEEVRKGRFREDLYYRLKVFPIEIPPLRERLEDIPLLVFAFMEEFSSRMGKKITKIPRKAMEILQGHGWPGNIRELRNVVEHSVILTAGDTLKLTVLGDSPTRGAQPVTLAEAEREHILKMLESTGWRIKGAHGAAARLDLQPSTLYSRMQKLGIPHRRQKDEMASEGWPYDSVGAAAARVASP